MYIRSTCTISSALIENQVSTNNIWWCRIAKKNFWSYLSSYLDLSSFLVALSPATKIINKPKFGFKQKVILTTMVTTKTSISWLTMMLKEMKRHMMVMIMTTRRRMMMTKGALKRSKVQWIVKRKFFGLYYPMLKINGFADLLLSCLTQSQSYFVCHHFSKERTCFALKSFLCQVHASHWWALYSL